MAWLTSLWHRIHTHQWQPRITKSRNPPPRLLALPDDILFEIVRHVTHTNPNPTQPTTVHRSSFRAAQGLALSCRTLCVMFYRTLDSLSLSSSAVNDSVIQTISKNSAPVLRRLVLRGCTSITNHALFSLALRTTRLRSVDLSFITDIDDAGISALIDAAAPHLVTLLLRQCPHVTDVSLKAIGNCHSLQTLDISYCPRVTDAGMSAIAKGCGPSLRLLAIAHNTALTDKTFVMLGKYATSLEQLCARGLPNLTDVGFSKLCAGVGCVIEGIDITLCVSLTRDATLRSMRTSCKKIYPNVMPAYAARSLRQIIVSTLRQNIFIVHGTDPVTRKDTVHTVLIDNGDIVSASLLSSGTTDLSMLGIVLCKSYGSALNQDTKKMLENDYGIPSSSLMD